MKATTHAPAHTSLVFGPRFRELISGLSEKVLELQKQLGFTYIAGTGHSGAMVVAAVSFHTGIPMWAVRKPGDVAHDKLICNGSVVDGEQTYLIIDDLIASGRTVNHIIDELYDDPELLPVGVLLYFEAYETWAPEGQQWTTRFESALGTIPTFKYTLPYEA